MSSAASSASPSARTRVVVTGMGVTSPLGGDVDSTWSALLAGKSGVRRLTYDWVEMTPIHIGAPVAVEPADLLTRPEMNRLDRTGQLAMIAARQAWAQAGFSPTREEDPLVDKDKLGVAIASGIGGVITLINAYDTLNQRGSRRVLPLTVPMLMPNGPAAAVSLEFGARAGVHTPVSACASGAEAISLGLDMIRLGRAEVVICGGTEAAIHQLPVAGFAAMHALSERNDEPERASRPYDTERDGFVIGEGAGIVVLESAQHAAARGATVLAELAGSGISSDAYHVAAPDPDGAGAARAVRAALADAGMTTDQVAHINAHATSTPAGDMAEVAALRAGLGSGVEQIPVSATKSMTGHLLGAAGALEAVLTIQALRTQTAPPTINLDHPEPELSIDVVRDQPRPLDPNRPYGLNNSFGFGGHNITLAFRRAS